MIMATGKKTFKGTVTGLVTGAVNGLFGGGGGMVVVPLLKNMLGYKEKNAHATAILIIAPICAASAVIYIINGYFSAEIVIPAAIGSVVGGLLGAFLLNKLPEFVINLLFVAVMIVAGVRMIL